MANEENKDLNGDNVAKSKQEDIRKSRKEQDKKLTIVLIILCVLAIILIIVAILANQHKRNNPSSGNPTSGGQNGQNSVVVQQTEVVEKKDEYHNPGEFYANAATKIVEGTFDNPEGSSSNVRYKITLNDTGDVIYESPILAAGEAVTEIVLSDSFACEPGDYQITYEVRSFNPTNGESTSAFINPTVLHVSAAEE